MTLVVFLRGVNVGGHRSFRPTWLAEQLRHLGATNIGATGLLVIRKPVGRSQLRDEIRRRLPFDAEIVICDGKDVARLVLRDFFSGHRARRDVIRFVSVLSRRPRLAPSLPAILPPEGQWMVKVLAREGRFVIGLHRRRMKAIGYLGQLDRIFGVPVTTRGWGTITAVARAVSDVHGGTA